MFIFFCFFQIVSGKTQIKSETRKEFNVSSAQFQALAKETYEKVLPCITRSWMMENVSRHFSFPRDAEQHYYDILNATAPFRIQLPHNHSGYLGPWIENHYISHFSDRPLSYFRGLIPIFVQWVDNQVEHIDNFIAVREVLRKVLRPNVLYVTVSQSAVGLNETSLEHPNLLVFSAGGFGHVPIPLIKGRIRSIPPPKHYQTDIGFYGTIEGRANRVDMMRFVEEAANNQNMTFRAGLSTSWVKNMSTTKFNLAPRGYGRTSFRFAEIIQMGRIPIFLYNDLPWIPYEGSNISISSYGFIGRLTTDNKTNTIPQVIEKAKLLTTEQYEKKMQTLSNIRQFFTYSGVIRQIELFFRNPFGPRGGHLTCGTFPRTRDCCG